jgi:hypothetical protein
LTSRHVITFKFGHKLLTYQSLISIFSQLIDQMTRYSIFSQDSVITWREVDILNIRVVRLASILLVESD